MEIPMLTRFIIAFIFFTFTHISFAQKTYLTFCAGYNLGTNATTLNNTSSNSGTATNFKSIDLSLGKGANIDGTFGYLFNKYFGAELGISYLLGGTTSFEENYNNGSYTGTNTKNYSSNMIRFIPAVVFITNYKKINPYAKIGLILGTGSYILNTEDVSNYKNGSMEVITSEIKYNGGLAFGYSSAFGVLHQLNEKWSLFGEFNLINLSYAASKSEVQKFTVNGVSQMQKRTVYDTQTEYSDNYVYDSSSPINTSLPRKGLKQNISYSSIGFNIGLKYNF